MRLWVFACALLAQGLYQPCYADKYWDKTMMIAANASIVMDWAQTRYIADHPDVYHEKNPIIGKNPTTGKVNRYFLGYLLLSNLTAQMLPDKQKTLFYGAVLTYELGFISNNRSIGIQFQF